MKKKPLPKKISADVAGWQNVGNPRRNDVLKSKEFQIVAALAFGVLTLGAGGSAVAQDPMKIGFVTHAQGNPFIQQIVDGAEAAAKDLGVTLVVSQESGGDPEAQLRAVQNFVNSGVKGVATSVP